MNVQVNSKVSWSCAAGKLTGTVKSITNGMNAANKMVPWILVENITKVSGMPLSNTMLCGTDDNITALNLKVVA